MTLDGAAELTKTADHDPARAPGTGRRSTARRFARALAHRWPTSLGLGLAALQLADMADGTEFAFILLFAAIGYLGIAVINRPRATWGVLVLMLAAVAALRVLGVNEWTTSIAAAVAFGTVGLIGGQLRRPGLYSLQVVAVLVFGTLAVVAVAVSPQVGSYLVAVGLIAHAGWDAVHWWADKVVARSLAEWCAVLDLTLGVGILVLA
jgi:hypothetical protein